MKASETCLWFALISLIVFFVGVFALAGWKIGMIIYGAICFLIGCVSYSGHKEDEDREKTEQDR